MSYKKTNSVPFCEICKLVSTTKTETASKHYSEAKSEREVFCSVTAGVNRTEYYEAYRAGVRLSLTIEINEDDYAEEREVKYKDKCYNIVRTYPTGYGTLELSCEEVIR